MLYEYLCYTSGRSSPAPANPETDANKPPKWKPRAAAGESPGPAGPAGSRKVLMVHGFCQSAEIFSSRTSNLRRKAIKLPAGKPEFVFAESPLAVHPELTPDPEQDLRAWYNPAEAGDGQTRPVSSRGYNGWIGPLDALRAKVREEGPFAGLLAFSQGGVPAAVLLAEMPEQFGFGMFVSCFAPADPAVSGLIRGRLAVRSLHVTGDADEFVSGERSRELAELFEQPVLASHPGGHIMIPKELTPTVKQFIADALA